MKSFLTFLLASVVAYAATLISPVSLKAAEPESMLFSDIPVVYTQSAGFFAMDRKKAPGSTWIIDQDELAQKPIVYMSDVFEYYVPDTNVQQQAWNGASIGTRGIAADQNSKTVFMYNGQSLNMKTHYGYSFPLDLPFLGDVSSIEVTNGPGTMTHGSGAISGFVNVLTKNGHDDKGIYLNYKKGEQEGLDSYEFGYGSDMGEKKNNYLYLGFAKAPGYTPDYFYNQQNNTMVVVSSANQPGYSGNVLPVNYRDIKAYRINEGLKMADYMRMDKFSLDTIFQKINMGMGSLKDLGGNNMFSGDDRYKYETMLAVHPAYTQKLNDASSLELAVPLELFDQGIKIKDNEDQSAKCGSEEHLKGNLVYRLESLSKSNKLAVGAGYGTRKFTPRKQYFEYSNPDDAINTFQECLFAQWYESELYGEDVQTLFDDKLSISVGARWDGVKYDTMRDPDHSDWVMKPKSISATSPRAALSYEINKANIVKASVQKGFRWPDATNFVFWNRINGALGAAGLASAQLPSLKPEKVTSYEANYSYVPIYKSEIKWTLDANVYYNVYEDSLFWKGLDATTMGAAAYTVAGNALGWGGGGGCGQNATGKFSSEGIELISNLDLAKNTKVNLAYSYARPAALSQSVNNSVGVGNLTLDASGNVTNKAWAAFPTHQVKANWEQKWDDKLSTTLTGYYTPPVAVPGTDSSNIWLEPRLRFNAAVGVQLQKDLKLTMMIMNLTQDKGVPIGWATNNPAQSGYLGDNARRAYVNLTWKL